MKPFCIKISMLVDYQIQQLQAEKKHEQNPDRIYVRDVRIVEFLKWMNQHRGCDSLFWLVKGNTNSPRPTVSRLVSEMLHLQCVWRVSPWINHHVYPFRKFAQCETLVDPWPSWRVWETTDADGNLKQDKSQKCTLALLREKNSLDTVATLN